jgi:hypothetical protein
MVGFDRSIDLDAFAFTTLRPTGKRTSEKREPTFRPGISSSVFFKGFPGTAADEGTIGGPLNCHAKRAGSGIVIARVSINPSGVYK